MGDSTLHFFTNFNQHAWSLNIMYVSIEFSFVLASHKSSLKVYQTQLWKKMWSTNKNFIYYRWVMGILLQMSTNILNLSSSGIWPQSRQPCPSLYDRAVAKSLPFNSNRNTPMTIKVYPRSINPYYIVGYYHLKYDNTLGLAVSMRRIVHMWVKVYRNIVILPTNL